MNKLPTQDEHSEIRALLGLDKPRASRLLDRRQLRWAGPAAAVLVLVALAIYVRGGSSVEQTFVVQPASRADLTVIVTATGSVQPTNQVDISSELSGTIRSVLVDYNAPVKVGQVLAELDTDKLKATLNSSRAKLDSAKAKVLDAEATLVERRIIYERRSALATSRVLSQQDLDTAKAAYDRAVAALESTKADVGVAEADVMLNETNLGKSRIVSPINGVVLKRNVDPGQTVASSFQAPVLFTIAEDLTQMEVQVDVDEADVGKVKEGQQGSFSVDAHPDRRFQARIRELRYGSEVVQGVVTYKAVLTTDNSDLLLRPGMTATAEIIVQQVSQALTVPNAALRYSPSARQSEQNTSLLRRLLPGRPPFRSASQRDESGPNRRVWALKDGAPVPVPVVAGVSDGQRTQIVKGDIREGQGVIVDNATAKP